MLSPPVMFLFTDRSKEERLMWFSVLLVLVSVYALFSPSVCLDDF